MGEFLGIVFGALISGGVIYFIFKKENAEKIEEVMKGADREVSKELKKLEIGNQSDIANTEQKLIKEIQKENAAIASQMNEIIEQQNKITNEYNNKMVEIQQSLNGLRELEIKNQKATIETTKNISNDKIIADVVSKATIKWIEDVRYKASDFITEFSKYIEGNTDKWASIQYDKEILILHFGPDLVKINIKPEEGIFVSENKIVIEEEVKQLLLDKESNSGKNDFVVRYIEVLTEFYREPKRTEDIKKINENNKRISQIYKERDVELEEDDDGEVIGVKYIEDDMQRTEIRVLEQEIKYLQVNLDDYKVDFSLFNQILRTYLKIEWRRAKRLK